LISYKHAFARDGIQDLLARSLRPINLSERSPPHGSSHSRRTAAPLTDNTRQTRMQLNLRRRSKDRPSPASFYARPPRTQPSINTLTPLTLAHSRCPPWHPAASGARSRYSHIPDTILSIFVVAKSLRGSCLMISGNGFGRRCRHPRDNRSRRQNEGNEHRQRLIGFFDSPVNDRPA